jgi:hypothetical protein
MKGIWRNSVLGTFTKIDTFRVWLKSCKNVTLHHRFGVLTEIVTRNSVFWDVTPLITLKVSWRFGGLCRFNLQDWRVSQGRKQHEAGSKQCRLTFNRLHGLTCQEMELFSLLDDLHAHISSVTRQIFVGAKNVSASGYIFTVCLMLFVIVNQNWGQAPELLRHIYIYPVLLMQMFKLHCYYNLPKVT